MIADVDVLHLATVAFVNVKCWCLRVRCGLRQKFAEFNKVIDKVETLVIFVDPLNITQEKHFFIHQTSHFVRIASFELHEQLVRSCHPNDLSRLAWHLFIISMVIIGSLQACGHCCNLRCSLLVNEVGTYCLGRNFIHVFKAFGSWALFPLRSCWHWGIGNGSVSMPLPCLLFQVRVSWSRTLCFRTFLRKLTTAKFQKTQLALLCVAGLVWSRMGRPWPRPWKCYPKKEEETSYHHTLRRRHTSEKWVVVGKNNSHFSCAVFTISTGTTVDVVFIHMHVEDWKSQNECFVLFGDVTLFFVFHDKGCKCNQRTFISYTKHARAQKSARANTHTHTHTRKADAKLGVLAASVWKGIYCLFDHRYIHLYFKGWQLNKFKSLKSLTC